MSRLSNVLHPKIDATGKIIPWYQRLTHPDMIGVEFDNRYFIGCFTTLSMEDGTTFTCTQFDGLLKATSEELKALVDNSLGDRKGYIAAQYIPFNTANNYRNWQYFWDEGVAAVTYNDDETSVTLFTTNDADRLAISDAIRPLTAKKRSDGKVFAMVSSPNGISLKPISSKNSKVPFTPENYSEETVNKYRYMVEQLNSPTPNGRIMLLRGSPGVGKSYLVRSLVGEVAKATFIVVPASMVSELDGPGIVGTLINTYSNADGAVVIILEDADSVLAPRGAMNMPALSSMLNLSDGILGELMDLRIIATTNALKSELDPAIVRAGRLCVDVEFKNLPYEQAVEVYRRLKKDPTATLPEVRDYMLADIYKMARPDTKPELDKKTDKQQLGF